MLASSFPILVYVEIRLRPMVLAMISLIFFFFFCIGVGNPLKMLNLFSKNTSNNQIFLLRFAKNTIECCCHKWVLDISEACLN